MPHEEYEYIVIGSGAGGGPLAANLARHGYQVLLLEAGDDQGENLNTQIPAFHSTSAEDPNVRWDFFVKHYEDQEQAARDPNMTWTTPEGHTFIGKHPPSGSKQKGIYYPRAGTLGGCTMHNAMMTSLPPDEDWQQITDITGDRSWEPHHMMRYFKRLERCGYLDKGAEGHGFHGWLETDVPDPVFLESQQPFLKTALKIAGSEENGHPPKIIHDGNEPQSHGKEGVLETALSITKHGRRSGPRDYIVATATARNADGSKKYPLTVRSRSLATKVLFNQTSAKPKAIGVEFLEGKGLYQADPRYSPDRPAEKKQVFASKELVVAGGAFNTPQLLKLSGIGPKDELEKVGIPVVVDLPGVGCNLQDNYEYHVLSRSPHNISIFENALFGLAADPFLRQWMTEGKGPYKASGPPMGIKKASKMARDEAYDLYFFGGAYSFTGFFPGYSRAIASSFDRFCWNFLKVHPRNAGVGTVSLRTSNPRQVPDINFRFFDDRNDPDHDIDAMADGVALAREMFREVSHIIGRQEELNPGPDHKSDAAIKQDIKDKSFSHHATSTCAIGADDDRLACLDSKFRVRGVDGLRVVDASVFPRVPGGFPVLPIYMISEKATDVIIEDAQSGQQKQKSMAERTAPVF